MRTKTLLIAAAALAVGVASSMAQTYSLNVVGYVNLPIAANHFWFLGNQLQTGSDVNQTNNDAIAVIHTKSLENIIDKLMLHNFECFLIAVSFDRPAKVMV